MNEWIKVEDKLPRWDEIVLVYNEKDGIGMGEYDEEQVRSYIESDGSTFYTNSGWETDYSWAPYMSPTHWMPLPKPPN